MTYSKSQDFDKMFLMVVEVSSVGTKSYILEMVSYLLLNEILIRAQTSSPIQLRGRNRYM